MQRIRTENFLTRSRKNAKFENKLRELENDMRLLDKFDKIELKHHYDSLDIQSPGYLQDFYSKPL